MTTTSRFWKERCRRQDAAAARLYAINLSTSDDEIIESVADYLIANGSPRRPHRLHLSILDMTEDRPVPYDWQYKNARGISTTDEARARAWIGECMRKGYCVFSSQRKHGFASGMGTIEKVRRRNLPALQRVSLP